ncbi:MAG TPA: phosphoglycerate dehydrogenase [Candidatus Dormibacteraeota bacterium]|nr:phosphoglycerate dehydrogenase [Candidatus Dormibacteraeota bacterium]
MSSPIASDRPRILVADPIAADGIARLRAVGEVEVALKLSEEQLAERVGPFQALVVRSETKVTAKVIAAGAQLRVIGRAGVGVDNIDVEAASAHGVLVVNAPTGNTVAAAEHTLALMLALVRNVARGDSALRSGRWERAQLVGSELRGKTLAVIGLGKIGAEVARMAQGLQMRVVAFDPLVSRERAEQLGVELLSLDEALARADVLTVHTPLSEATRGLIGPEQLARMPQGSRVLNVGRGGIVDEGALADAVRLAHLAGAAVDVFTKEPPDPDNPLLHEPAILVTPHLGASTVEAQLSVANDVADQIAEVLAGRPARWAVNAPAVAPEEASLIVPYQALAATMGSLYAQLGGGRIRGVEMLFRGDLAAVQPGSITAEALGGILRTFTQDRVTAVNARAVARQRGIEVTEQRGRGPGTWSSSLVLRVDGDGPSELEGTTASGEPRIVRLNGLRIDLDPHGRFLFFEHQDRPGLIGSIGQLLGQANVNIAEMQVGRDAPRGRAVTAVKIDESVPPALAAELRAIDGVTDLHLVSF